MLHRHRRKDHRADGSRVSGVRVAPRSGDGDEQEHLRLEAARAQLIAEFTHQVNASLDDVAASAQLLAGQVRNAVGDACVVSLLGDDGERLAPVGMALPD